MESPPPQQQQQQQHQLSRTISAESARSWQQLTTASGTSPTGTKARSSEPETGGENVERASVSMPPSGSQAMRQLPCRQPSKACEGSRCEASSFLSGTAGDSAGATSTTLGALRGGYSGSPALTAPDSFRLPPSDVDVVSKRRSLTSLYSLGSALYAHSRGHSWSGRSSMAESEGTSDVTARRALVSLLVHPPVWAMVAKNNKN